MAKRVHIVGRKNSGKTALIVELVRELTQRGLKIGTIKHTHHHHEFDAPGKDSYLHRQAGAVVVGLVGPAMAAAFREHSEADRMTAIDKLEPLFADCDLVLVEGQQQADAVKVEVWRACMEQVPLAITVPGIVALVSDECYENLECPIWPRTGISAIADQILKLNS